MNLTTALALVIGALGAVATWLFLGPLATLGLQIWVAFIAWASFYHCGGGEAGRHGPGTRPRDGRGLGGGGFGNRRQGHHTLPRAKPLAM